MHSISIARWTHRKAYAWEDHLRILHPDWQPKEGEGPVAEWVKEWVASNFFSETDGGIQCCLPARCIDVQAAEVNQSSVKIVALCSVGDGGIVRLRLAIGARPSAGASANSPHGKFTIWLSKVRSCEIRLGPTRKLHGRLRGNCTVDYGNCTIIFLHSLFQNPHSQFFCTVFSERHQCRLRSRDDVRRVWRYSCPVFRPCSALVTPRSPGSHAPLGACGSEARPHGRTATR